MTLQNELDSPLETSAHDASDICTAKIENIGCICSENVWIYAPSTPKARMLQKYL